VIEIYNIEKCKYNGIYGYLNFFSLITYADNLDVNLGVFSLDANSWATLDYVS
jgi:hypothetical protein